MKISFCLFAFCIACADVANADAAAQPIAATAPVATVEPAAQQPAAPRQAWEVNGIRLEPAQVDRLSENVAKQTVLTVEKLEGLSLNDSQRMQLEDIYRRTALRVYEQAVQVVAREDLDDKTKESQIIDLVLNGQTYSTRQVETVLAEDQYKIYRAWELRQIEAFKTRGLWANDSQKRGRRRTR